MATAWTSLKIPGSITETKPPERYLIPAECEVAIFRSDGHAQLFFRRGLRCGRGLRTALAPVPVHRHARSQIPGVKIRIAYQFQAAATCANGTGGDWGLRRRVGALESGDVSPHAKFRQQTGSFSGEAALRARLSHPFAQMSPPSARLTWSARGFVMPVREVVTAIRTTVTVVRDPVTVIRTDVMPVREAVTPVRGVVSVFRIPHSHSAIETASSARRLEASAFL